MASILFLCVWFELLTDLFFSSFSFVFFSYVLHFHSILLFSSTDFRRSKINLDIIHLRVSRHFGCIHKPVKSDMHYKQTIKSKYLMDQKYSRYINTIDWLMLFFCIFVFFFILFPFIFRYIGSFLFRHSLALKILLNYDCSGFKQNREKAYRILDFLVFFPW